MLSRLIGEDIQFTLVLDPSIARVRVDPGQLDQVLMNLAVNARDAMPQGGALTVRTQRVVLTAPVASRLECAPGPHVMVAVTDTGVGMAPEVMARIFEPFFTTKGIGTGTGLGLAMVFGIVRQSGGAIEVESAPGAGSTFRIYLPVVADTLARTADEIAQSLRGVETLLLVEDDDGVRDLAAANLRGQGYTVLAASDGEAALALLATHTADQTTPIDLLVTDVVMPRMSGPELAARLQQTSPATRVLFMSGYTDDAVVRQGVMQAEVAFLQKPYTPQTLARKVRSVLDDTSAAPV
jgi:CheY-like chemotaxis protein